MVWRDALSVSVHVYYCTCMYILRSQFGEVPWSVGVEVFMQYCLGPVVCRGPMLILYCTVEA
jgi:hypothetical protein